MSEESKQQFNEDIEEAKLLIDKPSDFRFHAAYLAYSETWDKTTSRETKTELNKIMSSLSEEEISYSSFYRRLDQFRRQDAMRQGYSKRRI
ncbi:MAG: hypothetical protein JSV75_03750, partial [Candidatus Bathyarchaeota archaeon]